VSKPNNIRKKALEHAKKGHWEKALDEFTRLVEIEQHNPNVFNEVGDIHLKLGNKREAFRYYHEAISAYAKVGLINNAVAVCKKILRLNSGDDLVYGRMATLRQSQGFGREAVAYSLQFIDKILKRSDPGDENLRSLVVEVARVLPSEPEVLERAAECLAAWDAVDEAGAILEKLEELYRTRGMAAERERARAKMESIGHVAAPSAASQSDELESIESHRKNAGTVLAGVEAPFSKSVPPHIRRGHDGDGAADFGVIDVGNPKKNDSSKTTRSPGSPRGETAADAIGSKAKGEFEADPSALDRDWLSGVHSRPVAAPPRTSTPIDKDRSASPAEYVIPLEDVSGGLENVFGNDSEARETPVPPTRCEADAAAEVKADVEDGDYRSHYDLGMAYLEMSLLNEAIREFQIAAHSPAYQVRSLEMIGRCFITQNQPASAIKHLAKGLALVEGDDRDALGIKYSLALAYEMAGEPDRAKAFFEDVYAVDVTFRDVEERMRKYVS